MPNPRKRKAAIAQALKAMSEAKSREEVETLREIVDEIASAPVAEVSAADWLQKRAEDIAQALGQMEPKKVTPVKTIKAPKKKTTKKKVKRGRRTATKKTNN